MPDAVTLVARGLGAPRDFEAAIDLILARLRSTARSVGHGLPHWADPATGAWTTTPDGDWTGGAWIGMLWCAARLTGDDAFRRRADKDLDLLKGRLGVRSAFRGFPFYYGAVLGDLFFSDAKAAALAMSCAESLLGMYSPALRLIPLGSGAEEGSDIGEAVSSIDSLQASPLLYWAFRRSGVVRYREVARNHTASVLAIHQRADGSIVQSSELDARTGSVLRHFTHKGYSDDSTWGRAQAWGLLYAVLAAEQDHEGHHWLEFAIASAQWWIDHLPDDGIAPWDFDAPAAPTYIRDTAATAIATVALLKLAALTADTEVARSCRRCATHSLDSMITAHLTPQGDDDRRPPGMLIDACFNNRPDSRPQDAVTSAEFIVGSFFLLQALLIATGRIEPADF